MKIMNQPQMRAIWMMITDDLNLMVDSDLDYHSFFNLCCFSYSMIKRQQILLSNIRQIALNLKKSY